MNTRTGERSERLKRQCVAEQTGVEGEGSLQSGLRHRVAKGNARPVRASKRSEVNQAAILVHRDDTVGRGERPCSSLASERATSHRFLFLRCIGRWHREDDLECTEGSWALKREREAVLGSETSRKRERRALFKFEKGFPEEKGASCR